MDAVQAGHKWAVDRSITKAYAEDVTDGLDAFMRDLVAESAIIIFEVFPDTERNTVSHIAQGKVYWRIRFTDLQPAENPNFLFEVTDQWMIESDRPRHYCLSCRGQTFYGSTRLVSDKYSGGFRPGGADDIFLWAASDCFVFSGMMGFCAP
ncbi:hypothetical protein HNR03_001672 [Pseudomonas sp. JAI111]|nr:hypothetical protein [Pseudomonas sp. JAI111]